MSDLIDISAALVASPRPCAPVFGARLLADDAQPRLVGRSTTADTSMAWRHLNSSTKRGFEAAEHGTYGTTKQHFSIRSGPPTSRPPA